MRIEIKMPQLGESIYEGKVTKWLKKVGDDVERDEDLLEVMTDKVTVEVPCIAKGKLVEILVEEEQTAKIGEVLGYIEGEGAKVAAEKQPASAAPKAQQPPPPKASTVSPKKEEAPRPKTKIKGEREIPPGVRTLAEELGVDLNLITGTGENGRVRRKDVLDYLAQQKDRIRPAKEPEVPLEEGDSLVPLTEMRRAIAEHMVLSKGTMPHVMTAHEVDMSAVIADREKSKDKASVTAYILKSAAAALKKFTAVNAVFTQQGIIHRKAVNIGVAVATEEGLLVPVVKHADQKSIPELNKEVKDLAGRARSNKLKPGEVHGGTFTVTNPGVFNSLISSPVIPYGQAAILGVGTMKMRPVVINDKIEIRPIIILSISFDHRTLDGATADQFLEEIRLNLEK